MRFVVGVFRLIWVGLLVCFVLFAVLVLFRFISSSTKGRMIRRVAAWLPMAFGIRVRVKGRVPDEGSRSTGISSRGKGYLICANHISFADIFVLDSVLPLPTPHIVGGKTEIDYDDSISVDYDLPSGHSIGEATVGDLHDHPGVRIYVVIEETDDMVPGLFGDPGPDGCLPHEVLVRPLNRTVRIVDGGGESIQWLLHGIHDAVPLDQGDDRVASPAYLPNLVVGLVVPKALVVYRVNPFFDIHHLFPLPYETCRVSL